jgi:DNA (cytosine-5)-methyltransferase 1
MAQAAKRITRSEMPSSTVQAPPHRAMGGMEVPFTGRSAMPDGIGVTPKAVSLFAGCGGDTLGLITAGFDVICYAENWKAAVASHDENFPLCSPLGARGHRDIRKVSDSEFASLRGRVDLLFAGFPCQGFSHAGKKDPNDPRNRLFWEFVRATSQIRPRWVVGENVSGLLHRTTDDGVTPVSQVITGAFEETGYKMAEPFVLNAADFGVPQQRRRVFFVGSRDGQLYRPPIGDFGTHGRLKGKPWVGIREFLAFTLEGAVPFDPTKVSGGVESFLEDPGNAVPFGTPHPYLVSKLAEGRVSYSKRDSPYHVEVADLDAPAKTLHSGYSFQPRLFVPLRNRTGTFLRPFTVPELARLQGFPPEFRVSGSTSEAITQIGNAVPSALAAAVARRVLSCDPNLAPSHAARSDLRAWATSAPTL